ncbi:MAG: TetR family transcriptional regulator [Actinomycetota bacterium]
MDRAARRAERREVLLDAAIECLRREGPDASMDDIAAEAGVTKPILYRYFRHKADLYDSLAARYLDLVAASLRKPMRRKDHPRAVLRSAIDAYIRLVERDTEIYRFLTRRGRLSGWSGEGPVQDFMRCLGDEIGLVLGERLREAGLDSGPAEVWGHAIVGMISSAVDWWVDRPVLPRARLVGYLTDLLWGGFGGSGRPAVPVASSSDPAPSDVVVSMRRKR